MGHVAKPSIAGSSTLRLPTSSRNSGYGAVHQNAEFRGDKNLPERAVAVGKPLEISSPYPCEKAPAKPRR